MRGSLIFGTIAVGIMTARAEGVVIAAGDGTGNTSEPTNITGWNNIVDVNVVGYGIYASGIYLGNGWMLTADHVGAGQVYFGGQYYQPSATQFQLTTPGYGSADLLLYQLQSGLPGLSPISIPAVYTLTGASQFYAIGANGEDRGTALAYFNDSNGTLVAATESSYQYSGYYNNEDATAKRWGTNYPAYFNTPGDYIEPVGDSNGTTSSFASVFENNSTYGEQLAPGDSGGGVFDGSDTLIGLNLGYSFPGDITSGPDASVFGSASYYAYLPDYAAQIDLDMASVPEPSLGVILFAAAAASLRRRRLK